MDAGSCDPGVAPRICKNQGMADAKQGEVLSSDGNENPHRNRNEATAICGMRARRFLGDDAPPRDLHSTFSHRFNQSEIALNLATEILEGH
jgi:hypothetical protein